MKSASINEPSMALNLTILSAVESGMRMNCCAAAELARSKAAATTDAECFK